MKHPRFVHLFFAIVFYGFLGAAGAIWIHFACPVPLSRLFQVENRWLTYCVGIGAGLAVAGISALLVRYYKPAKVLEQEFGYLLGNQGVGEIFLLAGMSGVAEEILFRGALQQWVGPYLSAAIFALAHPPFNRRLAMWPVFAFAVGLLFSFELELTGNLVAPVLTHVVINLINLLRISTKYRLLG